MYGNATYQELGTDDWRLNQRSQISNDWDGLKVMAHCKSKAVWLSLGIALLSNNGYPCSVARIISNVDMVKAADVIVWAKAVDYTRPSSDPSHMTTGVPDSRVRFTVIETVKGQAIQELALPGYLVSKDDFNDKPAPYSFVRPGGRAGSCFANSYRRDAQYLLFLKKPKDGEFTVNWAALAPVNEQLRSSEDPWLIWVREQANKPKNASQK